jgi:hypothetical protein
MGKNGARLISIKQYRMTDLFLFAVILLIAEVTTHYAMIWFPDEAIYTFSFMVPIVLVVMVRWGWQSIFYALGSALMYCILNGASGRMYLVYLVGNSFIMFMLLPLKLIGDKKITSKWYFTLIFVLCAWLCVYVGRSLCWTISYLISPEQGVEVYQGFVSFAVSDIFSCIMAIVIVAVLRKLDGMFENQKAYLKRLDKERRDRLKMDDFGLEPVEIDKETLDILNKGSDLYD